MTKILMIFLLLFPFNVSGQRDSIFRNSDININVSDVAKRFVVFNPGFLFIASNSISLQSKISPSIENTELSIRKIGSLMRVFSYSSGKLMKIINSSDGNIGAIDSLFYNGDTLKLIKNYIVGSGNNELRFFYFNYTLNSIYPISYTRNGIIHLLTFAANGNLLQERSSVFPYQTNQFNYDSNGNVTYINEGGYRISYYTTHDTSYSLYSNSLALKLWTYVKGLSTTQFSVNNPINFTRIRSGITGTGVIIYKYHASGYPKEFLASDDTGYSSFEEFDYNY
jgi:hypothetical protein